MNTLINASKAFRVVKIGIEREIQTEIENFQYRCETCIVSYFKQSSQLVIQNISLAKPTGATGHAGIVETGLQGRREVKVFSMKMSMIYKLNQNIELKNI